MTSQTSRRFLMVLLLIAIGLVAFLIAPFAGAFFAAAVLAAALDPLQGRLTRLFGKGKVAAAALTVAVMLVVVVPVGIMSALVIREVTKAATWVSGTVAEKGVDGLLEHLPGPLRRIADQALRALPADLLPRQPSAGTGGESAAAASTEAHPDRAASEPTEATTPKAEPARPPAALPNIAPAAAAATDVLGRLLELIVHSGIFLIALFFLLLEGPLLVDYLVGLMPLDQTRSRTLLGAFREVAVSVLLSTIVTAAAQTLAALIGYLIAGISALPLVLFATFVCAFIPAIGAASVTVAAGVILWISGHAGMGIFLACWGLVVVGLIDNVLKPILARGGAELPSSIIFFAMVCGLVVFGAMGLVAGPIVVVFFHVAARMVREARQAPVGTDAAA